MSLGEASLLCFCEFELLLERLGETGTDLVGFVDKESELERFSELVYGFDVYLKWPSLVG